MSYTDYSTFCGLGNKLLKKRKEKKIRKIPYNDNSCWEVEESYGCSPPQLTQAPRPPESWCVPDFSFLNAPMEAKKDHGLRDGISGGTSKGRI